jgi:hypothetical protein
MPAKKKTAKKKPSKATRRASAKKKPAARKKSAGPKKAAKKKVAARKKTAARTASTPRGEVRESTIASGAIRRGRGLGSEAAGQSGDLQGLSRRREADSESVEELIEEGNTFEADVVAGVEDADADEKPVRTHELPEDDVPEEYLDRDS